jgi:RNA polymerase sigma-70 factor (ECF subfamily)
MKQETSDMELIQMYLSGDGSAFDLLYRRYKNQLYTYLNRLLNGERSNADDIFQQTWLNIIRNLPHYKDSERFLAWAMRIAHNQSVDFFRKRTRKAEDAFDENWAEEQQDSILYKQSSSSPEEELKQTELNRAIEDAVQTLPPEMKQVFLLRQEDVSFREIATIQKCSINTCLARMQYALKKLRAQLGEWAG